MGFVAPELVVESRLRAMIAAIRTDPSIIDDAMSRFTPSGLQEVRSYLTQREIKVIQGWPQGNAQVPCIAVALRPASEQSQRQSLTPFEMYPTEGGNATTIATFMQCTIQCACYGYSQREATMIGMVVWWALWLLRLTFQGERMLEQSITISDYEAVPSNDEGGGMWFLRAVNLNCTTLETLTMIESPVIAAAYLSIQDTDVV